MKIIFNQLISKNLLLVSLLVSVLSFSQENAITYELFIENELFSEKKCISDNINISSLKVKIDKGDASKVKSTSLTIILNEMFEEQFSDYKEFNKFNLKEWLLNHKTSNNKEFLVFDYFILMNDNSTQRIKRKYCVKNIEKFIIENSIQIDEFVKLPIFFATDRNYNPNEDFEDQFGGERSDLKYGFSVISIPKSHKAGEIESPSYWKLEFWEDPNKHIVVHSINMLNKYNFFTKLSDRIDLSPKKRTFLFIHGFNVSFIDAAKRTAQMTYDLKFDGAPVFYSWPSKASVGAYTMDEATIEWSEKKVENFLKDYLSKTNAEEIYLIAHSMGNRALTKAIIAVVSENPELKSKIKEIILAAPDIDAGVFKRDIAPEMVKTINKPITLYVSSKDLALKASEQVHGATRAGDSKNSILVVEGIETIDASSVDTSMFGMGHSYISDSPTILDDILNLIKTSNRANVREKLIKIKTDKNVFWEIYFEN
ncbi:MAG: hypothetical protein COB12_00190 [Flavobacterium sp.]|nr:MAG: hypothetical protein COB12_00190 [Flavobacterium sp.]